MKNKLAYAVSLAVAIGLEASAADYETAQQLQDGDLLSADVLNDILNRIELTLKPITNNELEGDWVATQIVCNNFYYPNCAEASADFTFPTGTYGRREVEVSVTDNGDGTVQLNTDDYNIFGYKVNGDAAMNETCAVAEGVVLSCGVAGSGVYVHRTMLRTSDTQFRLSLPPSYNGASSFYVTLLDKVVGTPTAPSSLRSTGADDGVNLAWQDNSSDETGFVIKRKSTIDGAYQELAQAGANVVSFKDTEVASDTTYWYRVGARNGAGDRLYTNVVRHKTNTITSG